MCFQHQAWHTTGGFNGSGGKKFYLFLLLSLKLWIWCEVEGVQMLSTGVCSKAHFASRVAAQYEQKWNVYNTFIKEYGELPPHYPLLFANLKQIILSTWKWWSRRMESGCVNHWIEVNANQPDPCIKLCLWGRGGIFVTTVGIPVTHWPLCVKA